MVGQRVWSLLFGLTSGDQEFGEKPEVRTGQNDDTASVRLTSCSVQRSSCFRTRSTCRLSMFCGPRFIFASKSLTYRKKRMPRHIWNQYHHTSPSGIESSRSQVSRIVLYWLQFDSHSHHSCFFHPDTVKKKDIQVNKHHVYEHERSHYRLGRPSRREGPHRGHSDLPESGRQFRGSRIFG